MRRRTGAEPPPLPSGKQQEWQTIKRLIPYLWPTGEQELKTRVIIALALLVGAKIANVYVPIVYAKAVDALSVGTPALIVVPVALIAGFGLLRIVQLAFTELQDAVFVKVTQRAIRRVGLQAFKHLHALSLRFHLERRTGGLSRIIERGTGGIEILLRLILFRAGPSLLELLMVCLILWGLFDWRYALATLFTIGGYIAFTLIITEWRLQFRRAMNETDADAHTKAVDSLINYETVKYFGNEALETERFDTSLKAYEHASIKSKTSLSALNIGQGAIVSGGLIWVNLMAGYGVADGTLSVGDFVMVNSYLIQLFLPLNFLGMVYREIKQSLIDMELMFGLIDTPPEIVNPSDARAFAPGGGTISYDDVQFAYNPDRPIIKGISFDVPPGKKVAIVGPSGAGKSTISRLLFRFYDVTGGGVSIDGQDVRAVTQESLRKVIGMVPQDTVLFNDTIEYNIAYGRPDATTAEIEDAAKAAKIHDFITSLPQGYDTMVGERGLKLSGGEKQRVAIARAILKRPEIFVFDEATSSLDTHTERDIQDSLAEISKGKTTLVIAHRLSTVIDADEILVLDDGRIAERGSHDSLLAQGGAYAAMWARQQETARLRDALDDIADPDSAAVLSA